MAEAVFDHDRLDVYRLAVDAARILVPAEVLALVPAALARRYGVLPVARRDDDWLDIVACEDDIDAAVMQLESLTGLRVRQLPVTDPDAVRRAIRLYYPDEAEDGPGTPLTQFVNLLGRALQAHSSDLHIDPMENGGAVRMRIDGMLCTDQTLPAETTAEIVSAIKVAAGLDIAEHRVPQDGQMNMTSRGESVTMRVATVPTLRGEKATVRILATGEMGVELSEIEQLGMSDAHFTMFANTLRTPHGIVLLSGPTGSGKTTTLYAGLRRIKESGELHILTIEDPVEIPLDGITQVRVDSERVSFNRALRSALRHDPDVIMIGEIRDAETADIAVKAALTGHLVLSTVHTNDAVGVVTRLLNLGVAPDLLASTLRLAVAQRLVRRPCPHCVEWVEPTMHVCERFGWDENHGTIRAPRAVGCPLCAGTGYAGRIGLYEMLAVNDDVRAAVQAGGNEEALRRAGFDAGRLPRLFEDGAAKILAGETTPEEVERVAALG